MSNDTVQTKRMSQMFKVLGNPYRLKIVMLLRNGELNVTQLNSNIKVSQPALSQHLSKLRRDGVLGARREQRQIFYFLNNPQVLKLLDVAEGKGCAA